MWGACRDRQVRTPPPFSLPTEMLQSDRGAHGGRGPIFAFLGRGDRAGAAQAAGSRLSYSETEEPYSSQRIWDLALTTIGCLRVRPREQTWIDADERECANDSASVRMANKPLNTDASELAPVSLTLAGVLPHGR